jgi:hypothetical protein
MDPKELIAAPPVFGLVGSHVFLFLNFVHTGRKEGIIASTVSLRNTGLDLLYLLMKSLR